MAARVLPLLALAVFVLSGCVASPANRGFWGQYEKHPTGDEQLVTGVVNGVYKLNPEWTRRYLDIYASDLPEEERERLSTQYVIRVGYKRMAPGVVFLPFFSVKYANKSSDFVLLPEGWVADPAAISSDGKVINVGDIVRVKTQEGRLFDYFDSFVRKCSDQPASGEDPDWNLGCRTYQGYDANGYAGEKYYLRPF